MNSRFDNSRFRTTCSRKSDRITHLSHRNGNGTRKQNTTYYNYVTAVLFPTLSQYVAKDFQTKRFISNVNVTGTCATTPWHTLIQSEGINDLEFTKFTSCL